MADELGIDDKMIRFEALLCSESGDDAGTKWILWQAISEHIQKLSDDLEQARGDVHELGMVISDIQDTLDTLRPATKPIELAQVPQKKK